MADTLEDAGYTVIGPCVKLHECEPIVANETFDGALLDFNLGGGDTSEPLACLLRQRGIPFAFVTAYNATNIDGVKSDDVIIQKPVSRSLILEAVAAW